MNLHAFLLPTASLLIALLPTAAPADEKAELKKLEGTWKVVKIVNDGQEGDTEQLKDQRIIISGNKYTLKHPEHSSKGELELDPDQNPAHMDASYATDSGETGRVECIYKIEGDKLSICWNQDSRPSSFQAEAGSGNRLMVFEREKSQ